MAWNETKWFAYILHRYIHTRTYQYIASVQYMVLHEEIQYNILLHAHSFAAMLALHCIHTRIRTGTYIHTLQQFGFRCITSHQVTLQDTPVKIKQSMHVYIIVFIYYMCIKIYAHALAMLFKHLNGDFCEFLCAPPSRGSDSTPAPSNSKRFHMNRSPFWNSPDPARQSSWGKKEGNSRNNQRLTIYQLAMKYDFWTESGLVLEEITRLPNYSVVPRVVPRWG